MQLRELARKRQTKAKRCAACWRPAALIEHVEDPIDHLCAIPMPASRTRTTASASTRTSSMSMRPPSGGVAKQVCQHLHQPPVVTEDLTASIRSELQVQQLRRSAIGDSISTAALIPFFEIEPFQAER